MTTLTDRLASTIAEAEFKHNSPDYYATYMAIAGSWAVIWEASRERFPAAMAAAEAVTEKYRVEDKQ